MTSTVLEVRGCVVGVRGISVGEQIEAKMSDFFYCNLFFILKENKTRFAHGKTLYEECNSRFSHESFPNGAVDQPCPCQRTNDPVVLKPNILKMQSSQNEKTDLDEYPIHISII